MTQARRVPAIKQLKNQIDSIETEIGMYESAIGLAEGEERQVLQDHVRALKAKLFLTQKTRDNVRKQFYKGLYGA